MENISNHNRKITIIVSLVAFFLFCFLYHLSLSKYGLSIGDEGRFLYSAQSINADELPGRDYWIQETPGSHYIQSVIFKIFGTSVKVGKLSMVILIVIICWLLFAVSTKLTPFPYNLIPPVIYCFWGISQVNMAWYAHYALFFCLCCAYLFTNYITTKKLKWIFFSGLAAGLCVLMKQNLGGACFLGITAFLLLENTIELRIKKENMFFRKIFILTTATVIPFLVMCAVYYKNHALNPLFKHIFGVALSATQKRFIIKVFPDIELPLVTTIMLYFWILSCTYLLLSKKMKRLSITACTGILLIATVVTFIPKLRYFENIFHYFTFGLINAVFNIPALCGWIGIFSFIRWFKKIKPLQEKTNILFLFTVVFSMFYFLISLILSKDYIHITLHIAPCFLPLAFIGYKLGSFIKEKFKDKKLALLPFAKKATFLKICLIPVPIFLLAIRGIFASLNNDILYIGSPPKYMMKHELKINRAKGIFIEEQKARDVEQAVDYIQKVTNKDEYIFLFPSGEMIYFLAERKHPYIKTSFDPDIFRAEEQPEVIASIKEKDVNYIVVWNEAIDFEKEFSNKDSVIAMICKFITDNYGPVKDFGRFTIWKRGLT